MSKDVSLSDLANGAAPTATPVGMPPTTLDPNKVADVDISKVAQPGKADEEIAKYTTGNPILDSAFKGLDATTERLANESAALVDQGREERLEEALESDNAADDDIDAIEENTSGTIHVQNFDDAPAQQPAPTQQAEAAISQRVGAQLAKISKKIDEELPDSAKVTEAAMAAPVTGTVTKPIKLVEDTPTTNDVDDDDLFVDIDAEDMQFLDDDEEEPTSEETADAEENKDKTEAIKETIRQEMRENFKPYANKVDLSRFTISKKPITAAKVINSIKQKPIECADAVLYDIGRPVRMSAWGPMEIQSINPDQVRSGNINYNAFMERKMRLIYDHLIDANKPKSFEAWAMSTPNTTMDDYMFAAYKATYGNANIVTFNCSDDDCANVFMQHVPVNDMIKFKDDATKEKYYNILHNGSVDTVSDEYEVALFQVSDDFVFGLKKPSLYNTYIEPTLLDSAFSTKYQDLILLITYIECAYMIDRENGSLVLIDTKPVADKATTYKRRVKTFAAILKSLTSDQLQALSVETDKYDAGKLDDNGNLIKDITYVFPERRCPKCGKKIDEVEVAPDNMLFTRHQLGLMNKI